MAGREGEEAGVNRAEAELQLQSTLQGTLELE